MKNLMESNIYEAKGNILICGSCLPTMEPIGFKKIIKNYDNIFNVCLENIHINMIITKICSMISTKKINSITFASVDKSPHCIQLHYTKKEIERIMGRIIPIKNIIITENKIYDINEEIILLSKNLVKLSNNIETIN